MHLVTFETVEEKKAILESEWLNRWFLDMRDIEDEHASKWKETKLKVFGVPLKGWGYDNFYDIGCIFGRTVSVDYSRFDYAIITVITDCLFEVNCKIVMVMEGKSHIVCIYEEKSCKNSDEGGAPPPQNHPTTEEDDDENDDVNMSSVPLPQNRLKSPNPLTSLASPISAHDDSADKSNDESIINITSSQVNLKESPIPSLT